MTTELRHPSAFLFPLRLFLGIGWLRAFAEKAMSTDWYDGSAVAAFLDAQVASNSVAFPIYRHLIDSALRPGSRWIGWLVLALQLAVGLGILSGTYCNLAILIGMTMNANFMLAGQVSPSAFYVMIQTVLFVTGAGAILGTDGGRSRDPRRQHSILLVARSDTRRASNADKAVVVALAALAASFGWYGFSHVTDFSGAGVFDPGLVFGTVMALAAVSHVILRSRLGDLGRPPVAN